MAVAAGAATGVTMAGLTGAGAIAAAGGGERTGWEGTGAGGCVAAIGGVGGDATKDAGVGVAAGGGVPAPSRAGLMRNGGKACALADPAEISRTGKRAIPNFSRREECMPIKSVGATLATRRVQPEIACHPPEVQFPADARIAHSITSTLWNALPD